MWLTAMKSEPAFWDTSAVAPLCVSQSTTAASHRMMQKGHSLVVWWATPVEVISAFARLELAGSLDAEDLKRAMAKLTRLRDTWVEIVPSDRVRGRAEAFPRAHKLRAGDAFQLAASLAWCAERPQGRPFVCMDHRLAAAARDVGFTVFSDTI